LNRLSRVHERYRRQTTDDRQTDGRAIAYSEREREFTFAKKRLQTSCGSWNSDGKTWRRQLRTEMTSACGSMDVGWAEVKVTSVW